MSSHPAVAGIPGTGLVPALQGVLATKTTGTGKLSATVVWEQAGIAIQNGLNKTKKKRRAW